ncbi:diiron oxygenase [Sandaracinus amylolyticus]|uniref:diiron oxygenase n=1 Tax=Sandaracinus amylolyticus TaxID=927083 RepID=UPI001F35F764|nr:diiron oxygenase [Sandaracinus amylolyticus]UJR86054.1 Hypothetical protein I5071_81350 [Sandaracinus amylolyticus]
MLDLSFDYESCVRASEKVAWAIDDVMPPGTRLDFTRPFLPRTLAGRDELAFLNGRERRVLNQINGNAYLNLFAFVEEYILAVMTQHAHAELFGDHDAIRALLRFADEEAKHQKLFYRYVDAFRRDAGYDTEVLEGASDVASVVMSKSPIAVMMVTLHLEIMTQAHYVECIRDDDTIDPFFSKLLRMHWLEESQHARIDALELDKLLRLASPAQIEEAFADYLDLVAAIDGLLRTQAEMDARVLSRATERTFAAPERDAIVDSQHAGYRRTFLTFGMTNPMFARHLETIWPAGAARVRGRAVELTS